MPRKIVIVVAARPNFMKLSPILRALDQRGGSIGVVVHTGQHYDDNMSGVFFEDLGLRAPDVHLGVGSGTHAWQTAETMRRFEPVLAEHRPDVLVVLGDVNATLACALVAAKEGVRIAHVEAGLRSGDRSMPEEINRELTDRLADDLLTTGPDADATLLREGIGPERIHRVGNVMVDSVVQNVGRARDRRVRQRLDVPAGPYAALTLHRAGTVDDPARLGSAVDVIAAVSEHLPIVFPVHPRTRRRLSECGLAPRLAELPAVRLTEPLGYLDFLGLTADATVVLTDSGGLQAEATALGVPCLTLRETTEWQQTVSEGTNQVVGLDRERVVACVHDILSGKGKNGRVPLLWDGHAAERVASVLVGTSATTGSEVHA